MWTDRQHTPHSHACCQRLCINPETWECTQKLATSKACWGLTYTYQASLLLSHWGRVTHICIHKITIIGSDNGLSPVRRQAIIFTNEGMLLIRSLGINFSEILFEIHTFPFKKVHLKMSSGKWRPFCLSLNVLNLISLIYGLWINWKSTPIYNLAPTARQWCYAGVILHTFVYDQIIKHMKWFNS